jgi:hypothetical protein
MSTTSPLENAGVDVAEPAVSLSVKDGACSCKVDSSRSRSVGIDPLKSRRTTDSKGWSLLKAGSSRGGSVDIYSLKSRKWRGGANMNLIPPLVGVEVLMFKVLRGLCHWSGGVQTFDRCQYSSTVADDSVGIFQGSG